MGFAGLRLRAEVAPSNIGHVLVVPRPRRVQMAFYFVVCRIADRKVGLQHEAPRRRVGAQSDGRPDVAVREEDAADAGVSFVVAVTYLLVGGDWLGSKDGVAQRVAQLLDTAVVEAFWRGDDEGGARGRRAMAEMMLAEVDGHGDAGGDQSRAHRVARRSRRLRCVKSRATASKMMAGSTFGSPQMYRFFLPQLLISSYAPYSRYTFFEREAHRIFASGHDLQHHRLGVKWKLPAQILLQPRARRPAWPRQASLGSERAWPEAVRAQARANPQRRHRRPPRAAERVAARRCIGLHRLLGGPFPLTVAAACSFACALYALPFSAWPLPPAAGTTRRRQLQQATLLRRTARSSSTSVLAYSSLDPVANRQQQLLDCSFQLCEFLRLRRLLERIERAEQPSRTDLKRRAGGKPAARPLATADSDARCAILSKLAESALVSTPTLDAWLESQLP